MTNDSPASFVLKPGSSEPEATPAIARAGSVSFSDPVSERRFAERVNMPLATYNEQLAADAKNPAARYR